MRRPSARHWRAAPRRFSPNQSILRCCATKLIRGSNAPRDFVRYWHLADMGECTANVHLRGKADVIQGKADIKSCPLMTQSAQISGNNQTYLMSKSSCWQSLFGVPCGIQSNELF